MEVASVFSTTPVVNELFGEFIYGYPLLSLHGKDEDTAYFQKSDHEGPLRWQIYYHFIFEDVEHEFSYNYSDSQISFLRKFYCDQIYLFSVSYRSGEFLRELFRDFRFFLKNKDEHLISTVVLCDRIDEIYLLSDLNEPAAGEKFRKSEY